MINFTLMLTLAYRSSLTLLYAKSLGTHAFTAHSTLTLKPDSAPNAPTSHINPSDLLYRKRPDSCPIISSHAIHTAVFGRRLARPVTFSIVRTVNEVAALARVVWIYGIGAAPHEKVNIHRSITRRLGYFCLEWKEEAGPFSKIPTWSCKTGILSAEVRSGW